MSSIWPPAIDAVIRGDHVVMLAYSTPARGVVLLPLTNFGLCDGDVIALNSSVGVWRKLDRIRRSPCVAIAFHTRAHARSTRPEYVLVQGTATLSDPIPDYPSTVLDAWRRFEPWDETPRAWKWWQRVYALRVEIRVRVERCLVWPDLRCAGDVSVHGQPLPERPPASQAPPRGGTAPRITGAHRAASLPHVLLGWMDADRRPMVVPVEVLPGRGDSLELSAAEGLVPPGCRRAGLTAHRFDRQVIGQHQRKHTGWLEADAGGSIRYAPHTLSAYRFPASRTVYRLVSGYGTRRGLAGARRVGLAP